MTTDQIEHDWHQKIESALLQFKQFPALEEAFPFPWEKASAAIGEALNLPSLTLTPLSSGWKSFDALSSGMGEAPYIINLELSPIEGGVHLIFSKEAIRKLTSRILSAEGTQESFSDPALQQGFFRYLLLKSLAAVDQLNLFKDGSLSLLTDVALPSEGGYCLDFGMKLPPSSATYQPLYGRLVYTHLFLDAFKAHQPLQKPSLLTSEVIKQREISLHLEAGSVTLESQDWDQIQTGDFITLDHSSYDPETQKGSVTLMLGETPLLRGRVKPEGVKVLDYAFYYEDQTPHEDLEEKDEEISIEGEEEWMAPQEGIASEKTSEMNEALQLNVEIGRLSMTIEKLISLKPDMMLELSLPKNIAVMHKNRKVATAEFLKLGQLVGLRILEISPSHG